ncbi:unnamed protein product [Nyctereutes procyonoides]|uniref:(raccoon dog) hypothetical protein n=1 Tax=Nyctereutes procyonoides TaxID=34880 RepID=A0A811Z806_NYCPR|nr:unnamed protein product [Nyctereutes procyonoides]
MRLGNPGVLISSPSPNQTEHVSDAVRAMNGESLDGHPIHMDHSGKLAQGTRGGAFGARTMGVADMTVYLEDTDMEGQSGYDHYSRGNYRDNYDN